jgi:hypothetical protein
MNTSLEFFTFLNQTLPKDLNYRQMSNLCLSLYCSNSILPDKFKSININKENLAVFFSEIAKEKNIPFYPSNSSYYGASFHNSHNIGHWLEVMASVLKLGIEPDLKEAENILFCLV